MALERHNSAQEFDTMFRRHLKQGGAPVTPCVGFDADTASAYLERALEVSAQTQFEAHLAGCAACRRYVVGLARLDNEIESVTAKRPLVVAEPVWSRWYGTVAQWFDLAGWNRGWATAATACGLLLTALAVTTWRQMSAPQDAGKAVASILPGAAVPAQPGERQANASVPQPAIVSEVLQTESSRTQQAQASLIALADSGRRLTVPTPVTPPDITLSHNLMAVAPQPEIRSALSEINNPNFGSQPLPPPPPGLTAAPVAFGVSRQSLALPVGLGGLQPRRASSPVTLQPNKVELDEIVAELLPEPRLVRDEAAKSAANKKPASDPAAAARDRALVRALDKGHATGFLPFKGEEARTKEANVKEAKEQLKPLMKHLNGHTFYFDNHFWIDEEYKSDTTMPLIRLTRGNDRYQQTLIENPTLEQFFQLGPVIVVWKGKVYEVGK